MATTTIALARFSAGKMGQAGLVTLALAGAVAVASPAAADPTGVALVEGLTGNPSGVEFMDYVRAGQVIRLGPHQTMVLSYMASCVRETITGGTVTVGTQRSEVNPDMSEGSRATAIVAGWSSRAKRPMSGGESFAAQRTDHVQLTYLRVAPELSPA